MLPTTRLTIENSKRNYTLLFFYFQFQRNVFWLIFTYRLHGVYRTFISRWFDPISVGYFDWTALSKFSASVYWKPVYHWTTSYTPCWCINFLTQTACLAVSKPENWWWWWWWWWWCFVKIYCKLSTRINCSHLETDTHSGKENTNQTFITLCRRG